MITNPISLIDRLDPPSTPSSNSSEPLPVLTQPILPVPNNQELSKHLGKLKEQGYSNINDIYMDENSDEVSLGDIYDEYYDDLLDTGYHGDPVHPDDYANRDSIQ